MPTPAHGSSTFPRRAQLGHQVPMPSRWLVGVILVGASSCRRPISAPPVPEYIASASFSSGDIRAASTSRRRCAQQRIRRRCPSMRCAGLRSGRTRNTARSGCAGPRLVATEGGSWRRRHLRRFGGPRRRGRFGCDAAPARRESGSRAPPLSRLTAATGLRPRPSAQP